VELYQAVTHNHLKIIFLYPYFWDMDALYA
jgi:hypothetical protein